jgi:ABC-2 type transport system ATP-binding protein
MHARSAENCAQLSSPPVFAQVVVDVAGVDKHWPRRTWWGKRRPDGPAILKDLSLCVRRGEILAVLGENGAGKSTLLRIVAGLARPDRGTVRLFGGDAGSQSTERCQRVAYAGGERGFYYRLTVRENLQFFGALDGIEAVSLRRRIDEVARVVDLASSLERRFATLSSGLRQRVALARALLGDPELLLLDEPTHALDPPHAAAVRRFVRETLAGPLGKTLIVATNQIDEALEVGDRLAVLREGRLVFVESERLRDSARIRELFGMSCDA